MAGLMAQAANSHPVNLRRFSLLPVVPGVQVRRVFTPGGNLNHIFQSKFALVALDQVPQLQP